MQEFKQLSSNKLTVDVGKIRVLEEIRLKQRYRIMLLAVY